MATEDFTQRLKEDPPDPLEYIRQVHESWLTELEGLAVEAIATNDWTTFYAHVVDFQNEHDLHGEALIAVGEASADEMHNPSAGPSQTTNQTNRQD
jgi:hypothetical protein